MRSIQSPLVGLLGLCLCACVGSSDSRVSQDTRITPDVFRYATVVEAPADGSNGGWRAVCVKIELKPRSDDDTPARCDLEYGTPIKNHQHGYIPLHKAQRISAEVSNEEGRKVLEKARGITSTTCKSLRTALNEGMDEAINGSRVTECGVTLWDRPVPEVIWPPPRK